MKKRTLFFTALLFSFPFVHAQQTIEEALNLLRNFEKKKTYSFQLVHNLYYQHQSNTVNETSTKIVIKEPFYNYNAVDGVVSLNEKDSQIIIDHNDKSVYLHKLDTSYKSSHWFSFDSLLAQCSQVEFLNETAAILELTFNQKQFEFNKVTLHFSDQRLLKSVIYYQKVFNHTLANDEKIKSSPRLEILFRPLHKSNYPIKRHVTDFVMFDTNGTPILLNKLYEFYNQYTN